MKTIGLVLLLALAVVSQTRSVAADNPADGARRVEDAQPSAPQRADQAKQGDASGSAQVAGVTRLYAGEDTRKILLSTVQQRRPSPAGVRRQPQRGANVPPTQQARAPAQQATAARPSRNVRFNVPKVTVVNTSPNFRFIPVGDRKP
jgi:hypothetical protein